MINSSKLIVFEGLDCSFKETNSKALYDYLKNQGLKVSHFSFPSYYKESSFFIKEYLKGTYGKEPEDVPYDLASVLYMVDQFHVWKTEIEQLYKDKDQIIILDRFWTSNIYHQLGKLYTKKKMSTIEEIYIKDKIKEIIRFTRLFKLPYPDIIFRMRMHFDNMVELLKEKNSKNDIHEGKLEYLLKVHRFFNSDLFKIDNTYDIWCTGGNITETKGTLRSKENIFSDILEVATKWTETYNKKEWYRC